MEFDNEEDARGFYFDYARRVGFTIRIDKVRRSMRDRAIIARQYVCSKEGFCVSRRLAHEYKRQRTVKREGCMARMMVKREKSGKWVVSSFIKEHNHELVVAARDECCLQSRKHRCCATRKSSKVGCGEGSNGFYGRDVMSCIETSPQGTFGREAQKILDYFRGKQAKDQTFFYDVQLDDNRCLSNVIWADERSRRDYGYFGDVVVFDTTYKMNGYQVPFASFMGVNHHRQPVLFGCVLIVDQSEASYVWMFKTWLSAMQGRHPISMITVQDRAIQSAAAQVFPRTRLRFCLAHVLKRLWEHLPPMFVMQENFREDFNKCINQTDTVDEFEMNWRSLADRYALRNNEWFQTLHRDRQQWVPACLGNTFFAELYMTHQVNTFFDGYVNSQTTLKMIFKQVERALEGQVKRKLKKILRPLKLHLS
ncbi:Protein FAR1-RELATED SEQUENCE 5 [Acorus gramineus]|uniref:Protein FAR1-RELATED SEQUENCE n=1 Tax=Acorus gramineus TaxID=55184 RepID=A0AAV9ABP5_ACOGR|nr:Protein FAR1-RELATED SEQUENCE 5 [Acorus gramineus]